MPKVSFHQAVGICTSGAGSLQANILGRIAEYLEVCTEVWKILAEVKFLP